MLQMSLPKEAGHPNKAEWARMVSTKGPSTAHQGSLEPVTASFSAPLGLRMLGSLGGLVSWPSNGLV